MRLISAGSLVRAQSGPFSFSYFQFGFLYSVARLNHSSELEINKRNRTGCREEFERQKCAKVCRDLNARWLQSQAINELISFLRGGQEQRNEKEHNRPSGQQKFASYVLKTE